MRITEELQVCLTKAELKALLTFASKDATRARLSGVSIKANSANSPGFVGATDGHRAIKCEHADLRVPTIFGSLCIPRAALESAMKLMKKDGELCISPPVNLPLAGERDTQRRAVTVTTGGFSQAVTVSDDPPDLAVVFCSTLPECAGPFAVQVGYLADLTAFEGVAPKSAKGPQYVTVHAGAYLCPVYFCHPNAPEWRAVIMPCRDNATDLGDSKIAMLVDRDLVDQVREMEAYKPVRQAAIDAIAKRKRAARDAADLAAQQNYAVAAE